MLVATCTIHNAGVCRALALAHPAAHQATRGLFRALDCAAMAVSLPIALPNLRADADGACGTVLAWLQLACGLLAPLLWQAIREAALYARHKQQRYQEGLPPERGFDAALYDLVWSACGQRQRSFRVAAAYWLLMSLVWQACLLWFTLGAAGG